MDVRVVDNQDRSRWEIELDGRPVGYADYHVRGRTVVMPHTVIDPAHRGRGLAAELVREALAAVRSAGRLVDPQCWYVADYIRDHPDEADLLAS